jgi:hypothetical protein
MLGAEIMQGMPVKPPSKKSGIESNLPAVENRQDHPAYIPFRVYKPEWSRVA